MRARTVAVFFALALVAPACVTRPRTCVMPTECGEGVACVSGRCVAKEGVAEATYSERLVLDPVAVAYVRRHGEPARSGVRAVVIGRESDGGARLLLRFRTRLPPDVSIVEAHLLVDRVHMAGRATAPLLLRTARITEPWDPERVAWVTAPGQDDRGIAAAYVGVGAQRTTRLPVQSIVSRWRGHFGDDHGIALFADGATERGVAVALAPTADEAPLAGGEETALGPRLELYVRRRGAEPRRQGASPPPRGPESKLRRSN